MYRKKWEEEKLNDTKADLVAFSALKMSCHKVRKHDPRQLSRRIKPATRRHAATPPRTLSLRASSETSSLNFKMQASAFWKAATPSSVSVKDTIAMV